MNPLLTVSRGFVLFSSIGLGHVLRMLHILKESTPQQAHNMCLLTKLVNSFSLLPPTRRRQGLSGHKYYQLCGLHPPTPQTVFVFLPLYSVVKTIDFLSNSWWCFDSRLAAEHLWMAQASPTQSQEKDNIVWVFQRLSLGTECFRITTGRKSLGGHGQEVGGRHLANPLLHSISSILNYILVLWINGGPTDLKLLIKAVDSMQVCMNSSLSHMRDTFPHSSSRRLLRTKLSWRSPTKSRAGSGSRCLSRLLDLNKENYLN